MNRYLEVQKAGNPIFRVDISQMKISEVEKQLAALEEKFSSKEFEIVSYQSAKTKMEIV